MDYYKKYAKLIKKLKIKPYFIKSTRKLMELIKRIYMIVYFFS